MKKFVSAVAVFGCLAAFGSTGATAAVIGPPSVTGPATIANLTGGGGVLLSDRIQVIGPTGAVLGNKGVTDTDENNCGSGPAGNGLFNLFGAGLLVAGGCEFGVADHTIVSALPNIIPVNAALESRPTLVYEPDGTTLSDIFGIRCEEVFNGGNGGCYLVFVTKINEQPFVLPPGLDTSNWFSVTELAGGVGTIFDMTIYLDPTYQANSGATARFISATDVPEPSTLALFGAGFAGISAIRRRRKASGK